MEYPLLKFGGSGQPLNIAPANGFPPETYLPMLHPLPKNHRIICMPPRALWPKTVPPAHLGNWETDLTDDLLTALQRHDLNNVVALGHSFGAIASMLAVVKDPTRFSTLVMLDPTILTRQILNGLSAARAANALDDFPLANRALKRQRQFASREDAFAYFRSRGIFTDWSEPALRAYVDHGLVANAEGFELSWTPEWEAYYFKTAYTETWEVLPRLEGVLPTLIIRGAGSNTYLAGSARLVQDMLPSAVHIDIPGHGHLFPQSAPEQAGRHIADWLTSLGAS
ncbi:MAG: alpha/beta hydrolase [Chloroflexi bacterium]|nr:alpha/beta hydrolase [Chloroflexota bacterium]